MSIKADKWIRQQCVKPKYVRIINGRAMGLREPHNYEDHVSIQHAKRNAPERALSKTEIEMIVSRGFVLEYTEDVQAVYPWLPMIEPFEPNQVRERERSATTAEEAFAVRMRFTREEAMKHFKAQDVRTDPLIGMQIRENIISYGTSSYGYDIRCADEFKIFTNVNSAVVDPKNFDDKSFVDFKGDCCIIPPNSFALARTMEYFRIPRNVLTVCLGKSTYARCGIVVNVTPFEPEWEGYVTLEFSNTTPLPAKIYANEGCAQVLFFESDEVCETSYKDRAGKYQGQRGVVTPRT
ncbi:Deoxycytidine triphosphate deaminase [compost metagenome]